MEVIMKNHTRTLFALLLILMLAFGAGCAKDKVDAAPGQGDSDNAGMSEAEIAAKQLEQAKRIIMDEKVYFAFDSFELTPQARETLKRKADILRENTKLKILIEGNCDERGTQEYNLALGERRAMTAYKYLVLLGVNASQLETVSFGEERPAVQGHNENAWAQNRRDEFRPVW